MTVLVVDDSITFRKAIELELKKDGIVSVGVADGEMAIETLKNNDIKLITLDVEMPGLNGYETCRRIRELDDEVKAQVPIILITGKDTVESREEGFKSGATDFIIKANLLAQLSANVRKILSPEKTLSGARALVVDDSRTARQALKTVLEAKSVEVLTFKDGKEAFEFLKTDTSEIDLIITDKDMPEMSGIEFTDKVRKELGRKTVPIILISADHSQQSILNFFQAGGTDYMRKPALREELYARLVVHLEAQFLRKRLDEHVQELKELNKIKDDYLSIFSHDMKTPVNAILGYTELVKEELETEDVIRDLDQVVKSAGLLMEIINQILALGRIQNKKTMPKLSSIDMIPIMDLVVKIIKPMVDRKEIDFTFTNQSNTDKASIAGNETEITRLLNNLLSNAIKFTPKNGTIELSIKESTDGYEVYVKDSGVGMTEDQLSNLFTMFTSASRSGTEGEAGTGLGMVISKEIVDFHGGQIYVTSKKGEGTKVTFTLPKVKA